MMMPSLFSGRRSLWWLAAITSLLVLFGLLSQMDWKGFSHLTTGLSPAYLVIAISLLLTEGCITAARLSLFANNDSGFLAALPANAWYSVLVVVLPARLGEVGAILLLEKFLHQSRASAIMSILVQRLFDLMVLGVIFLLFLLFLVDLLPAPFALTSALAVIVGAALLMVRMDWLLQQLAAALLYGNRPGRHSLRRTLLRLVLQGRTWRRHTYRNGMASKALALTTAKWCCTLGSISCLFLALPSRLDIDSALVASAAYNFMAVIPIQSLGGIGAGEVGLAFVLTGMGFAKGIAVSISLYTRAALILFPFVFLGITYLLLFAVGALSVKPRGITNEKNG